MIVLEVVMALVAGLLAGSLTWTASYKLIRGGSVSLIPVCVSCGRRETLWRWLPLSWVWAPARCPACEFEDKRTRGLWELAAAVYYAAGLAVFDSELSPVRLVVASLPLMLILAVDITVQAVFMQTCYVAIVVGLFLGLTDSSREAANAAIGMLAATAIAFCFLVITKWLFRSLQIRTMPMGFSDLFVAAAIGAIVRADALIPALVVAVVLAAAYGVGTPILKPAARTRLAAFGPFLCIGGLAALLL